MADDNENSADRRAHRAKCLAAATDQEFRSDDSTRQAVAAYAAWLAAQGK
jgi:hypothetical protein